MPLDEIKNPPNGGFFIATTDRRQGRGDSFPQVVSLRETLKAWIPAYAGMIDFLSFFAARNVESLDPRLRGDD